MASNSEMGVEFLSGYHPAMLGSRLRVAREAAGLSQRQAARELGGVTHGAISQWESTGQISTHNLLQAAALYKCDPTWLLTGRGHAPGEPVDVRATCDRAVMTDAMEAVLSILRDTGRSPPPKVTARIINLIYNRHMETDPSVPIDAQRVRDIVSGVVDYLNHGGHEGVQDPPGQRVVNEQRRDDQD